MGIFTPFARSFPPWRWKYQIAVLWVTIGKIIKRPAPVFDDHPVLKQKRQKFPTINGYLADLR